MNENAVI